MFIIALIASLLGVIAFLVLLRNQVGRLKRSLTEDQFRIWFGRVYFGITLDPENKKENHVKTVLKKEKIAGTTVKETN